MTAEPEEPVTSLRDLPEDEPATWTCGYCSAWIQGGRRGLSLHMAVVHDDADLPPGSRR